MATGASATVIDFTAAGVGLFGNLGGGVTWTMTGDPDAPNNDQAFDGITPFAGQTFNLAFDTDGFGISDDEIAAEPPQNIMLSFWKGDEAYEVNILGFAFLDLFQLDGEDGESGILTVDAGASAGDPATVLMFNLANGVPKGGYAEVTGLNLFASKITFTVGRVNDNRGVADGALAALQIAPVPLPAGGLLLLTALGGVAALRRRRKAA
ncbi:MAG: hypothetical protein CVT80_02885 [Alphaproteobacteria bacterium HGW-Alphaproteobacteria-2]|nr:MAG: hypothetical protein CVT80_02885 [Alphaproteobacteria bacterium HGW-Alphaproteobacteria-2]